MEREDPSSALRWHFNGCVLDESSLQLSVRGAVVELERKPLEVLRYFLRHAGEVVTKDEVLEAVWPGRILSDTVLAKAISRLRDVLGETAADTLKTVHGYGYRLVAEVRVEQHTTPVPKQASLGLQRGDHPPLRPNWVLVAHLESGGRGEVWRVQHEKNSEQRVLKFALDDAALTSLKREITLNRLLRQSLGEQAAVTPLLDWNLQQPPFFIELPYLPQGSLADWAAAAGGLAQIPLATRLDVAAQIAEAVSAAHGVGVLHKDLKPANVLVTGTAENPLIQLTDFGSGSVMEQAKLDALGITRMGLTQSIGGSDSTSGTPLYFAPEVLAGQPHTVRSDNYALGVLLYQLSVGDFKKPLSPGWERDIADSLLREDIAAAADGNPVHRLGDAEELARRLRTLEARRAEHAASDAQRLSEQDARAAARAAQQENERLRLRRRWSLAVMVVLALGLGVSLMLYRDAEQARHDAQTAAATSDAVSRFLADDLLAGANPVKVDVGTLTVKQLLDNATGGIEQRFANEPVAEARVRQAIASSYVFLGHNDLAITQIRASWQVLSKLLGHDDPRLFTVAEITNGYADAMENEDLPLWQRVLDEVRARRGPEDLLTLQLGNMLGSGYYWRGDITQAIATLEPTLAAARRHQPPDRELEALILNMLGRSYTSLDRFADAERAARAALLIIPTLPEDGPESPFMSAQLQSLAAALWQQARYDEAEPVVQQALAIASKNAAPHSAQMVGAKSDLGVLRMKQGRWSEAEQLMQEILEARRSQYGNDHRQVFLARLNLAELAAAQAHWAVALPLYRQSLADLIRLRDDPERSSTRDARMVVSTQIAIANALRATGQIAAARQQLDAIPEDALKASWVTPLGKLPWLRLQGQLLLAEGKPEAAASMLDEATGISSRFYGQAHPTTQALLALSSKPISASHR
ncbi:MAG: tetratricopeptide repeat protein [Stagnimonas sp.]|nr:tetratricopeptide repeat protein [Stagnimonas sp.]